MTSATVKRKRIEAELVVYDVVKSHGPIELADLRVLIPMGIGAVVTLDRLLAKGAIRCTRKGKETYIELNL